MATSPSKSLDLALDAITKKFGEGAIMKIGDKSTLNIDCISTGSIAVDYVMGGKGIPRGRITEIYGPESSGKTTVCLQAIAEAQKNGGRAAFIDMEHALDPQYAAKLGVDLNELLISQPDDGEQALEIAQLLISSANVDIVVIDSVAALIPRVELEGDMGHATMGAHARLMSQAMRKLSGIINQTKTAVVFTNQIRMKIGLVFGNPETTTGGQALKFYASVRCNIRKSQAIKEGTEVVGNHVKIKAEKNKIAPPYKEAEFDIMYGEGISRAGEILDFGVSTGVINKRGNTMSYGEQKLGVGREAVKTYLNSNPTLMDTIRTEIMEKMLAQSALHVAGINTEAAVASPEEEAAVLENGETGEE